MAAFLRTRGGLYPAAPRTPEIVHSFAVRRVGTFSVVKTSGACPASGHAMVILMSP